MLMVNPGMPYVISSLTIQKEAEKGISLCHTTKYKLIQPDPHSEQT